MAGTATSSFVLWVHDEIVCSCRREIAGELMRKHAIEAGEHYGLKVPLAADYKIGRSWAGEPLSDIAPAGLVPEIAAEPEIMTPAPEPIRDRPVEDHNAKI